MDALKKEKDKHLGLRIDSELHYKLHYISQYEGRSANGEVIYLIRKAIEEDRFLEFKQDFYNKYYGNGGRK